MSKQLRKLAKLVFELNRRDIWLGGRSGYDSDRDRWPKGLDYPGNWGGYSGTYWTLSPEVELSGHRMRVCVSSNDGLSYEVHVFVDGELKHPGGRYDVFEAYVPHWWPWRSWASIVAEQERWEGGKTGPVDRRDLAITEATELLRVKTQPDKPEAGRLSLAAKEQP